ncbi:MAG: aspartate/glutamate racemase family protein [Deltaproteobacteria bacterium]|nr:aspartate/glutamate racemase family protein [Deltaproteobacteria bacterium]
MTQPEYRTSKIVGVLGGMGPYATLAFFQSLLTLTPAEKDWDHLRIIIDDNPHIPSRTRHVLYGETSPVEGMLESCLKLQQYPVDLIVLPCNSAAVFIPEIQPHLQIPLLNICEITANALVQKYPVARRVAVLGGHVTYRRNSYKAFLESHGVDLLDHGADIQKRSEQLIEAIKLDPTPVAHVQAMETIVMTLYKQWQVDAVIMACTEFGCLAKLEAPVPLIDSSLELAKHTVALALS